MTGFLGRYEYQLDQKGRLSLPAEYRRKVDSARFVLLQWESTHLTLYPEHVWTAVQQRLLELRRNRRDLANILREVVSRATDVEPDKQGRILIPGWLKDRAGLDGTVMVVGAVDRIELWSPATYLEHHPEELTVDGAQAEEMHGILG